MAFKLTENQSAAVNDRSGTLLVAAAAGSGKTAILTRRIVEKLCDPECDADISKSLIVTFTKAATSELRERLYKALSEYVQKNPGNARARRQLSLMGLAKISTIHSFCLDIIRSNFEAIGLPSKLTMGEDTEINILLRQVLEEIIAEKYESVGENEIFLKTVEVMSDAKSDEKLIEGIINLYKKIRSLPESKEQLSVFLENYRELSNQTEIFDTYFGRLIKSDLEYEISRIIAELSCIVKEVSTDEILSAALVAPIENDIAFLSSVKTSLGLGYESAKSAAEGFSATKAKPIRDYADKEYLEDVKELRSKCNSEIKGVFAKYLGADETIFRRAAKETYDILCELVNIFTQLDERFSKKKLERGLLDYCDLEQYTLKLLVEDTGLFGGTFRRTPLADALSKDYAEIYVDEYQDTNTVQDLIFRAISTYNEKGEEANRFLVGDVKQSIYRFRGAQPEIFKSYINEFPNVFSREAKATSKHKIYLSNNFRCSKNVIDTVNAVFDKVMDMYSTEDRLVYSKSETNTVSAPCELILIDTDKNELQEKEQISQEPLYIAKRIKEMAYNPDYTSESGEMYRYSDFAILSRSANSLANEYRRAFRVAGIPLSCDTPEDFFTLPEIMLVMCLLNCIDNPQRDIYVAGCMHSVIFGFSADELTTIRSVGRKMSFMQSVEKYAEESEGELCCKVKDFLEKIKKYRELSRGTATDVLLRTLYDDFSILELHAEKTHIKQKNLMRLYELSRNFEKTSFRGLSAFLDYLSGLASGEFEHRTESSGDSVKFMSIHRSKGLEFPVVILSGALREFNFSDEKDPVIFSAEHGIGVKLRDTQDSQITEVKRNFASINTPFREAIRGADRKDMLEEEKRLLYVAMTRARDRLIITALSKDADITLKRVKIKRKQGFEKYGKYALCYFDFLYHALTEKQFKGFDCDDAEKATDDFLVCRRYDMSVSELEKFFTDKVSEDISESIDEEKAKYLTSLLGEIKSKEKTTGVLSKIPAKMSVSQLKKGLLDEEQDAGINHRLRPLPSFMLEKSAPDAAERGTATHVYMQFAKYESIEKLGAKAEADRLLAEKFISRRMYDIIDLSEIEAFIKSRLYEKIKKSSQLYRERRFNLRLPVSEFSKDTGADSSDFILVQGVSDLYFENGDGTLSLVDFKTDMVSGSDGEEILKERHTEQLVYYKRAIEEITGKTVSDVYIYSFCLGREILLDI